MISNASDALNKRKFEQLRNGEEPPALGMNISHQTIPYFFRLEINLTASKANNTLTFFDNGIGMSEEEAINHLGTIAKSGSKDFMSEVQESDRKGSIFMNCTTKADASSVI